MFMEVAQDDCIKGMDKVINHILTTI